MEKKKQDKNDFRTVAIFVVVVIFLIAIFGAIVIDRAYFYGTKDGHPNTAFSVSDMLIVYCALITFLGTAFLGCIAIWHNQKVFSQTQVIEAQKAVMDAEPVFSIDLVGINIRPPKNTVIRGFDDKDDYEIDNFVIRICNCGSKPVFNLFIFDSYLKAALFPNDNIDVYAAYNDSGLSNTFQEGLIFVGEEDFPRDVKHKYPQGILISYDDAFGNIKTQHQKLISFGETLFYAKNNQDVINIKA
jgi:hypothetical protein